MLNCKLIKDENKMLVCEDGQEALEFGVLIHDNNAWIDMMHMSDKKKEELNKAGMFMESYFNFLYDVIKEIKKELEVNGIIVNQVLLGGFSEIKEIDQLAQKIDQDYLEKETKIKLSSMR